MLIDTHNRDLLRLYDHVGFVVDRIPILIGSTAQLTDLAGAVAEIRQLFFDALRHRLPSDILIDLARSQLGDVALSEWISVGYHGALSPRLKLHNVDVDVVETRQHRKWRGHAHVQLCTGREEAYLEYASNDPRAQILDTLAARFDDFLSDLCQGTETP